MGHTTDEIAAAVGVHRSTVFRWRQIAGYRSAVASLVDDSQRVARMALQSGAHRAVKRLHELIDHEDPRIALRACLSVLDRTGHGTAHRLDLTGPSYASEERQADVEELVKVLDDIMGRRST
jgi:hypothetical protein